MDQKIEIYISPIAHRMVWKVTIGGELYANGWTYNSTNKETQIEGLINDAKNTIEDILIIRMSGNSSVKFTRYNPIESCKK